MSNERYIPVTEDELHAYVDGELPADRHAFVETWLASHPDDAARVAEWARLGVALCQRYAGVIDEPVPARLQLERLQPSPRRWMYGAVAATVLAFGAGGGIGWFAHGAAAANVASAAPINLMRNEAAAAHGLYIREVRHPIEVRADEAHLLPWLSGRIGTALRAPDLSSYDLKLLGGRLLPGPTAPAALLMYESASGERITLYSTPLKAPPSAFRYAADGGNTASVQWVADNYGWVVSGPADKARLKTVAMAVYEQLERK